MTRFDRAFDLVIDSEGGYTDNRADPGNWTGGRVGVGVLKGTKFGISAKSYPNLDIRNLTLDQAKAIYLRDYWDRCQCSAMPEGVGYALFDGAVNTGAGTAIRHLQEAVGAGVDGIIGPQTRGAAKAADPVRTIREMLYLRVFHYLRLSTFPTFGKGWIRRTMDVSIAATAMQLGRAPGSLPPALTAEARNLLEHARADIEAADALLVQA